MCFFFSFAEPKNKMNNMDAYFPNIFDESQGRIRQLEKTNKSKQTLLEIFLNPLKYKVWIMLNWKIGCL